MICPDCGGTNVGVIDNSFNPETNEHYRLRRCKDCLYRFYTMEFEVENTEQFQKDWKKYHRTTALNEQRVAERIAKRRNKKNVKNRKL